MREIKFRAWDGKKVFNFIGIKPESLEMYADRPKNIKQIMQYTGLKDKNGVEIYEGDVVKCSYGIGYIDYVESYFRIFRPYVLSINLCNETTKNTLLGENTVEVVGNIYENPELLENK